VSRVPRRNSVLARSAFTAYGTYEFVEILAVVIDGQFLARLNSARRIDHDTAVFHFRLHIRMAIVVDVASGILRRRAVQSPNIVDLEEVA